MLTIELRQSTRELNNKFTIRGLQPQGNHEIVENLGLFVVNQVESPIEQDQVGEQGVQVTVQSEQEQLTKVPVIQVRHHVKQ